MMISHVDKDGNPAMVDVSGKSASRRSATAESVVELPQKVVEAIRGDEIRGPKGPVLQTAIIAGTMAAKRTADLIPFCHQISLDGIRIEPSIAGNRLTIRCTVTARDVTGVEMEALTGATVAALTVYDMCKALSHEIVITGTRLLEKHGGKSDYVA
jgi:cyclic pyranopterin phosphate synthase